MNPVLANQTYIVPPLVCNVVLVGFMLIKKLILENVSQVEVGLSLIARVILETVLARAA